MELRQLEYFLMVSELGSFTRAAERLYVSQPAVTNAVRSLEEELDIRLLDRSQRKAVLTAEGKVFYRHIKNIMQGISTTLNEINDLKSHNLGRLSIGVTPLAGIAPCSEMLTAFRRAYPGITLSLIEADVEELCAQVHADKLEFAFIFCAPDAPHTAFHCLPLARQELTVACPRSHPLRRANSVALRELTEESFILMDDGCFFRRLLVKCFEDADIMPPVAMETAQVQLLKSLVADGLGISILPEHLIEHDDRLTSVPLSPPLYLYPALIRKAGRSLSHAAQAFAALAEKEGNASWS